MGCNLVVTRKGDTEEYFGDKVFYCEPDDVDSIRRAIDKAFHAPANEELRCMIRKNYNWSETAHQTKEAYKTALLPNH
jgi:glycosyltransferase involved in cell wall biosynthesis